jgi:hypothetical protein
MSDTRSPGRGANPAKIGRIRIVIVTYNWLPRNAIGTHRPLSWARHWAARGAKVTVLTAKKYAFDEPLDLANEPIPGVANVQPLGAFRDRSSRMIENGCCSWNRTE